MKKTGIVLLFVLIFILVGCQGSKSSVVLLERNSLENKEQGIVYGTSKNGSIVEIKGYTPYVYIPTVGSSDPNDIVTVSSMLDTYGKDEDVLLALNGGIFYNWSYSKGTTQYCFNIKEPDGLVIANGKVLKSTESIDHTECEALVIDAQGNMGWTDYWVDADALVLGQAYYYDIHGNKVDQKEDPEKYRIVSAVTGFVPILIDGVNQFNEKDELLHGYHNYVGHYTSSAQRVIIAANDESFGILQGKWTLQEGAEEALKAGYIFAYNLDGGGSSSLYITKDTNNDGFIDSSDQVTSYSALKESSRTVPTYIVFTSDNEAPQSSYPKALEVFFNSSEPLKASDSFDLYSLVKDLKVYETFTNANGSEASSKREVFCSKTIKKTYITNEVTNSLKTNSIVKSSTVIEGINYYNKSNEKLAYGLLGKKSNELDVCMTFNSNTRLSGAYYDYSTGYSLSSNDDLSTKGEKIVIVSYEGMKTEFKINLN
ncbi:MAG: phosphodiester glycosidase family protein [Sphaerochaetaceae bacterium]|nr:phosphodiester glycosidase family protein [Sphaerochaetaceae bacterium]